MQNHDLRGLETNYLDRACLPYPGMGSRTTLVTISNASKAQCILMYFITFHITLPSYMSPTLHTCFLYMCESTNIKTFESSKQLVIFLPTYLLTYVRTAVITSNNITVSYILGKVWLVDYLASFIHLYVKTVKL